jgi:HD-GYP domain-containing protein (c-di-GMP phosphodiesterase class II)
MNDDARTPQHERPRPVAAKEAGSAGSPDLVLEPISPEAKPRAGTPRGAAPAPGMAPPSGHGTSRQIHPEEMFLATIGVPVVVQLTTLIRIARTHDVTNQAFQRKLQDFMGLVLKALEDETDLTLSAVSDHFYLNGTRVRPAASYLTMYHALLVEFERRSIGGIKFSQGVTTAEFERFFQLFMAADDPALASRLGEAAEEASIFHIVPLDEQQIATEDTRALDAHDPGSERGRAKRVFWRAVLGTKKIVLHARQSGRPDLRHAKRLVQPVVDNIMKDEYSIVGLTALKDHDEYTYAHCVNVSILSISMGNMLGLERQTLADLGVGGLLHDVGKLMIPAEILRKPSKLTASEWTLMKRHPLEGVRMMIRMPGLSSLTLDSMRVAFEHHMNFDRSGYPQVTHEWGQSTLSRIVAVADCFDAMTAHRAYQSRPLSAFEALQYFLGPNRMMFDPAVLWALIRTVGIYPAGSMLQTESGHMVLSLSPNVNDLRRPHCRVLVLPDGTLVPEEDPLLWTPMPMHERVVRVLRPDEYQVNVGEALAA